MTKSRQIKKCSTWMDKLSIWWGRKGWTSRTVDVGGRPIKKAMWNEAKRAMGQWEIWMELVEMRTIEKMNDNLNITHPYNTLISKADVVWVDEKHFTNKGNAEYYFIYRSVPSFMSPKQCSPSRTPWYKSKEHGYPSEAPIFFLFFCFFVGVNYTSALVIWVCLYFIIDFYM